MKKHLNYANVAATLALVIAMSGGALAASHYVITNISQIKPSVRTQLRGPGVVVRGPTGPMGPANDCCLIPSFGAKGERGPTGPVGPEGPTGKQGPIGERGYIGVGFHIEGTWQEGHKYLQGGTAFRQERNDYAIVRDPGHPERLLPVYDGGNHFTPSEAGMKALANSINVELFK